MAPISYQYNFGIQREVARDLLVEVGYIGNVSHHLTANDLSLDQVAPELMGPGNAQARRPFPQFSNVTWINPSIGNSTYHGGFIRAEKRFGGSFSFLAHYTFSKFIDDVESANEYGVTGSYMDAYNRRLDKGLSGSDVPHHLVLTLLYELPPLRGNRLLKNTLGGWKLGVLETAESGAPFTVITSGNTTNAFPAGLLRPNLLHDAALSGDQRSIAHWFDTSAFGIAPLYSLGTDSRTQPNLFNPGTGNLNFVLSRSQPIKENMRLQFRADAFNPFNRTNFGVNGTVGNANFGRATGVQYGPRIITMGARLFF